MKARDHQPGKHPQRREPQAGYFGRHLRSAIVDDDDEEEQGAHEAEEEDTDGHDELAPLLPIFSAAHLESLSIYTLTHSIRILIVQRCETTLSWEQLRSPQISQFLVKPLQQQIRSSHFSRATLYALIANCLQFTREGHANPGNTGVCQSRASLAELLAIRLLREYSTRELIDGLSYDFDPLSGAAPGSSVRAGNEVLRSARTSTLEVAIRAQAKRFIAHPLVVEHLEAIWAGSIVFHSAADGLHRHPTKPIVKHARHHGAMHNRNLTTAESVGETSNSYFSGETVRRLVTLYDPSKASLFKLSRLRVPRYRLVFSTLSYSVMLSLFVAVLVQRVRDITTLEIVFWLWSAGFMLDELVGFSEQGFGLYIMSVWNAFDIGILLLFFTYYILRLFGILIADDYKHRIAKISYDILASTAVLLFPRLFSILDHYRYFSQLLIAFRLMAQDLAAVLVLIVISCSGFFAAFSLAFGNEDFTGTRVAYALFQILMGFTPAAWDVWDEYNVLGKAILTLFLIICHFLVVTILITVLTNSFMTVVKNANEEHQFLFAVNTISMVKSDALFSYIAPTNLLGWLLSPLRYVMSFGHFVKANRTVIKVTHFPILFVIFVYERLNLSYYGSENVKLVERQLRSAFDRKTRPLFSPGIRVREPTVATYRKDRALEEVFRRPFNGNSTSNKPLASHKATIVESWMNNMGNQSASAKQTPMVQPRPIPERSMTRPANLQRSKTYGQCATQARDVSSRRNSALSDPEEQSILSATQILNATLEDSDLDSRLHGVIEDTNADGDDELVTNDDDERDRSSTKEDESDKENLGSAKEAVRNPPNSTKIRIPLQHDPTISPFYTGPSNASPSNAACTSAPNESSFLGHTRISSTNTIIFKPLPIRNKFSPSPRLPALKTSRTASRPGTPLSPFRQSSNQTPKRSPHNPAIHHRPRLPSRDLNYSAPAIRHRNRRSPSFSALAFDLASDIGDNRHVGSTDAYAGPGSLQTEFAYAARKRPADGEESTLVSRMVLARMHTLEEGFRDMLKEVKEWRNAGSRGASAVEESSVDAVTKKAMSRRRGGS